MNPVASRTFGHLLALAALLLVIQAPSPVWAGAEATNPDLGKPFATVTRLRGEVSARSPQGGQRKLREGAQIHVGETVKAAANAEAVLKTTDAGMIAIRPDAEFVPERYAAEGKSTDRQILRLITGSLRIISGWISQTNRSEHKVITPSATIGIRGTDHEPYALPAEQASEQYAQGTYDKVNRGATTLVAHGGSVDIEPGKVGFARDPKAGKRTRALFTILLPTLLDKVPDFYVPGAFDAELDRYAAELETQPPQAPRAASPTTPSPPASPSSSPLSAATENSATGCKPQHIGEQWLKHFDAALAARDSALILVLFADDIRASATVRTQGGGTETLEFTRNEMVKSTLAAIASLQDYQQRRLSIQGRLAAGEAEKDCRRIDVGSVVIEQGRMSGKPYRFESTEDYQLELRHGVWQAIRASTRQR